MKKLIYMTIITVLLSLVTHITMAAISSVPNILSAPVVLYDEGGNPLQDGDYLAIIELTDQDGNTLYSEEQQIAVTNSVAALIIGQGYALGSNLSSPAGGLSQDIFDVAGDISVQITVEGAQTAQDSVILTSQPFAFISDKALSVAADSINSSSVRDGSITEDDLDESFVQELRSANVVNDNGETVALTAQSVTVSSDIGLSNSASASVHGVLKDLDAAIEGLENVNLAQSIEGVEAAVSNVDAELTAHTGTGVGVHGVSGAVVGTTDTQTLTNKTLGAGTQISGSAINSGTVGAAYIDSTIARDSEISDSYLKLAGGTLTGNLTLSEGNLALSEGKTVDGVDVSVLNSTVSTISGDIVTIEGDISNIQDGMASINDTPNLALSIVTNGSFKLLTEKGVTGGDIACGADYNEDVETVSIELSQESTGALSNDSYTYNPGGPFLVKVWFVQYQGSDGNHTSGNVAYKIRHNQDRTDSSWGAPNTYNFTTYLDIDLSEFDRSETTAELDGSCPESYIRVYYTVYEMTGY